MTQQNDLLVLEDDIGDVGGLRWVAKIDRAYFQFEHPAEVGVVATKWLKRNEMVIALGPCVTIRGGKFFTRCLTQHGVVWVAPTGLRTRENAAY